MPDGMCVLFLQNAMEAWQMGESPRQCAVRMREMDTSFQFYRNFIPTYSLPTLGKAASLSPPPILCSTAPNGPSDHCLQSEFESALIQNI